MKNKIVYVSIFLCLAGLAVAAEYTDWQNGAIEGLNKGFMMGQAYQLALDGKNIDDLNAKVDEYNAWVKANFGEDPNLLMQKMTAPIDLNKPVIITNNTTNSKGIAHEIDGSSGKNAITTNDMNLLSDAALNKLSKGGTVPVEGEYLVV